MKIVLLVLFLAAVWAQDGIQTALVDTIAAIRDKDDDAARARAIAGFTLIRDRAKRVRAESYKCGDLAGSADREGCRDKLLEELRALKVSRTQFHSLESCLKYFKSSKREMFSCTNVVEEHIKFRQQAQDLAPPAEKETEESEEKKVLLAVNSAREGEEDSSGDEAVRALRNRLTGLEKEATKCKDDACRSSEAAKTLAVRKQAQLLAEIERCMADFADAALRKRCQEPHRKALLELLAKVPATVSTTDAPETTEPQSVADEVKVAIKKAQNGEIDEPQAVKEALTDLRSLVADLEARSVACKKVAHPTDRYLCKKNLRNEKKARSHEIKLVEKLDVCAKKFELNDARRTNCVARVAQEIRKRARISDPLAAPKSLPKLEDTEKERRDQLMTRIKTLRKDLRACDDTKCRDEVRNAILVSRVELDTIDQRFSPRRVCLMKRRRMRSNEFRARALEHLRLFHLHERASKCSDRKCAFKYDLRQHDLERNIRQLRARRKAAWNKYRCPYVLPKTKKVATTLTEATVKPVTKAPTEKNASPRIVTVKKNKKSKKSKKNKKEKKEKKGDGVKGLTVEKKMSARELAKHERAKLVGMLQTYYKELDHCPDEECRSEVQSRISESEDKLKALSKTRKLVIKAERERHLRRATLHRKLEKLYNRAANCETRKCRKSTQKQLVKYKEALEKLGRTVLGSEKTGDKPAQGITKEVYVNELKLALGKCRVGSMGQKCRDQVLKKFDQETEKRDRKMITHLQELVSRKVIEDVEACTASNGSRASCVEAVRKWEAMRLTQLQTRQMRLEERVALRTCRETGNPKACKDSVRKEFKKDSAQVAVVAEQAASKDVKREVMKVAPDVKVRDAPATVSRSGSASTLAVSAAMFLIALTTVLVL